MKNNVCHKFTRIICIVFVFFLLTSCLSPIVANASDDEATESQSVLPPKVDLTEENDEGKKYFPALKHQAATSCSAWATAYYQFTYAVAEYLKTDINANNNNSFAFSPDYMFNYLNFKHGENNEGLNHKECYEFLKKQGCIRYSSFYGNDSDPYRWYGTGGEANALNNMREALKYRISEIHDNTIPNSTNNTFITGSNDADLNEMKALLNDGKLLGISTPTKNVKVTVERTNENNQKEYVTTLISSHFEKVNGVVDEKFHSLTIVGYDDNHFYDVNGNGVIENRERGAFIVVDSMVTRDWYENNQYYPGRKYMLLYESLNKVSAYDYTPSGSERQNSIIDNTYWYIDVDYYENQALTVEVTVSQQERNEFSISLVRDDGTPGIKEPVPTFVNAIGGNRSFNGGTPSLQSYTFVFDYEAHDLYDGAGYHYGVKIEDLNVGDGKNTVVQRIVWKIWDEEKKQLETIKDISPDDTLGQTNNSKAEDYYVTLEKISIQQDHELIQKGRTRTPNVVVEPSDLSFSYTLESSDASKIAVNNNQITAIETGGSADITATAVLSNGKVLTASCGYTVVQGFGNTRNDAHEVSLDTQNTGYVIVNGDESWLEFTAPKTEDYIFCVESIGNNANTRVVVYPENSNTPVSGTYKNYGSYFIYKADLIKNQKYFIKIYNQNGSYDDYIFRINKSVVEFGVADDNPDARHIQLEAVVSSLYDTLYLTVDGRVYPLSKTNTSLETFANTSIEYKVSVNDISTYYTKWTIHMDVSSDNSFVGVANTISGLFANYNAGIESPLSTVSVLTYKTSLLAGVDLSKNDSLSLLLNGLAQTGYNFEVYSASGSLVSNFGIKATTGMKIVKKETAIDKIVEVYHVIVIGDVQCDGYIDNLDSSLVLKHEADLGTITGAQLIAGDVNEDDVVDNLDASIILKYDAGLSNIAQVLYSSEVPIDVYFGLSVAF